MSRYFLLLIFVIMPLYSEMLTRTQVAMGTFVSISLDEKQKHHFKNIFQVIKDVELSLSSYDSSTPIYNLNKNKYANLDYYSYEALKLSQDYYERSNGYFDITVGSITKDLYKFGQEERVPSQGELENSFVNFKALTFNKSEASLEKYATIDLGGMGKGFGVDKAFEYLKKQALKRAVVALSGDIRCLGECHIDIQDPFSEGTLASFQTKSIETAISTSGNYNRFVENKENNHLINPKMKRPQDKFISITLISHMSNSDLDAYATATSVMPKELAYSFLESLDLAYIVIESNEELKFSDNLYFYVKDLFFHNATK